jgi:hypothetical protein
MIEKPNLRLYSNKLYENEAAGDYFIIDLNIRIADLGSALLFVSELNGLLMKYTPTTEQLRVSDMLERSSKSYPVAERSGASSGIHPDKPF